MGRHPELATARGNVVGTRLSDAGRAEAERRAAERGEKMSVYLRRLIEADARAHPVRTR